MVEVKTDVSPAAVAAMLSYLRGVCGMGEEADFIQVLAAERDELAARLAGADMEPAWIVWFDDVDVKPVTFTGNGATEAARKYFDMMTTAWNCHLFKRVDGPKDQYRASFVRGEMGNIEADRSETRLTRPKVDTSKDAVARHVEQFRAGVITNDADADLLDAIAAEHDELAAKLAEAEIISTAALQRSSYLANTKLGFVEALDACQRGLALWRDKPHNFKWWNRIDGTPIPNDLLVCIAEILQQTANMDRANLTAAQAEIARLRQQIAWFQAEAAKPPFRIEADFSPPLQEPAK